MFVTIINQEALFPVNQGGRGVITIDHTINHTTTESTTQSPTHTTTPVDLSPTLQEEARHHLDIKLVRQLPSTSTIPYFIPYFSYIVSRSRGIVIPHWLIVIGVFGGFVIPYLVPWFQSWEFKYYHNLRSHLYPEGGVPLAYTLCWLSPSPPFHRWVGLVHQQKNNTRTRGFHQPLVTIGRGVRTRYSLSLEKPYPNQVV